MAQVCTQEGPHHSDLSLGRTDLVTDDPFNFKSLFNHVKDKAKCCIIGDSVQGFAIANMEHNARQIIRQASMN